MSNPTGDVRSRLRVGVRQAMKAREREVIAAYRCALAAIDNAEAVAPDEYVSRAGAIEAAPVGVGVAEVNRRALTEQQMRDIVVAEAVEREQAAAQATDPATAQALRAGAQALSRLCGC